MSARRTLGGKCAYKILQSFRRDQIAKRFIEQIAEDRRGVIAWTDISQWVQGVIDALGPGRTIAKPQVREGAHIDQAGLDGDRTGDRDAKLIRCSLRYREGSPHLLHRRKQLIEMQSPASAGIEAVEHDRPRPEGKRQPDRFI